jgi:hypothetical protein
MGNPIMATMKISAGIIYAYPFRISRLLFLEYLLPIMSAPFQGI